MPRKRQKNKKYSPELKVAAVQAYLSGEVGQEPSYLAIEYLQAQFKKKRIRRLMRALQLHSVCRKKRKNYTPSTPEVTAENILNRDCHADKPNEKWLTDVTIFKCSSDPEVHKMYLSAILDLYDRRIWAYKLGAGNNNKLVFVTLNAAVTENTDAHPLFHSDRSFQYTSKTSRAKPDAAKMIQSMSVVGRCIDNGPMEGFWGILKS